MSRARKTDEADFRSDLRTALLPTFDCVSMETKIGDGLPDEFMTCKVSGQSSWIELKQFNVEGTYDSFRFDVKPEQAIFACRRVQVQRHTNALILGRINRREFIALPAMPDVDWTIWVRRVISLKGTPRYPLIRLRSYEQIAELLRDNLYLRYVDPTGT